MNFHQFPFSFLSNFFTPLLDTKWLSSKTTQETNNMQIYTVHNTALQSTNIENNDLYCVNMCLKRKNQGKHKHPQPSSVSECWERCSVQTKILESKIECLEQTLNDILTNGNRQTKIIKEDNSSLYAVKEKNKKVQANIPNKQDREKIDTILSSEGVPAIENESHSVVETKPVKAKQKEKIICPWQNSATGTLQSGEQVNSLKYSGSETVSRKTLMCRCENESVQFPGGKIGTGKSNGACHCGKHGPCYQNYITLDGKSSKDTKLLVHIVKELERQKQEIRKLKETLSLAKSTKLDSKQMPSSKLSKKVSDPFEKSTVNKQNQEDNTKKDAATLKKEYKEAGVSKTATTLDPDGSVEKTVAT